jgi:outer membrane murein-binding lipoprotein Lpp
VRYNDVVGLLVAGFQALVQRTDALASDVAGLTAENQALRQRMFAVESSFT